MDLARGLRATATLISGVSLPTRTESIFLAITHLVARLRGINCINLISRICCRYKGNNSPRDYNPVFVLSRYQQIRCSHVHVRSAVTPNTNFRAQPRKANDLPYKYVNALHSPSTPEWYTEATGEEGSSPRLAPPLNFCGVDTPRFVGLSQSRIRTGALHFSHELLRLNSWTTADFSFRLATGRITPLFIYARDVHTSKLELNVGSLLRTCKYYADYMLYGRPN